MKDLTPQLIELVIDDSGLRLDDTRLNQMLADQRAADPENYLADLLDLDRYACAFLAGANFMGLAAFDSPIETLPPMAGKSQRWRDGKCANEAAWRLAT